MAKKNIYITTTLPYVNADPHIGFALEIVQADAYARLRRLRGHEVFFNFGTDEHGIKIYRKAKESGKEPQKYVDEYAAKFDNLKKALNLSYNNFIRTTDKDHKKAAQEFWKLCKDNGYIYKKNYKIKYCVGCELEKTDSELNKYGKCDIHPDQDIEIIEEENYFFRFSEFQKALLDLYSKNPEFVVPNFRFNEIKHFVEEGLNDFSISRLKEKLPWGVEVPDDPDHVMYVWFDALINYISAIGWPNDKKKFEKWWPVIQFAGKDNLRQQSAIWQAMLLAAGVPNSKQIFIHGFINIGGQKISKSLGNVISPYELVDKYGTDALRYYLLAKIHPYEDSDFTLDKFKKEYNADLANGLGNLVARVGKLVEINNLDPKELKIERGNRIIVEIYPLVEEFRFDKALAYIWGAVSGLDKFIDRHELWKKSGKEAKSLLKEIIVGSESVTSLLEIAEALKPFLPETAKKIEEQFAGPKIKSSKPLFPRLLK